MDNDECLMLVYVIENYLERLRKAKDEIECIYKHVSEYISDIKIKCEESNNEYTNK